MARVVPGRMSARHDGDVVVFLIGMRINKLWAVRRWWPVFVAMPRMLVELSKNPASGLLGYHGWFAGRRIMYVQYWRSIEHLTAYADDPARAHRPAWLAFFKKSWHGNAVGIWHETYVVPAGAWESVYGNMPLFGLAKAAEQIPVGQAGESARDRLRV